MNDTAPIEVVWTGEALKPINPAWAKRAARQFVAGEVYHIAQQEPRSTNSHRHYFAAVNEVWSNLPEDLAERFPTSEHLRKYALIRTGWFNSAEVAASSHAEALRFAEFMRPIDEYAVISVKGAVVTRFTAKSQDRRMDKKGFQQSKDDVLGFLAGLVSVSRQELAANAGKAA